MVYVFTSSAPNYASKVLTLARSVKRHMPGARFVWLVSDLRDPEFIQAIPKGVVDEFIFVEDLQNLPGQSWLFTYNLVELSTAIKPFAAETLLKRPDCQKVIYLDPDTVVFSPLTDVLDALETSDIALTPHLCKPEPSFQGVLDNEIAALKHGIFNLGFLALKKSEQALAFARWWGERLVHFCQADVTKGVFTDQKWINFVPVFFDNVKILKTPRLNLAAWNLNQRHVTGSLATQVLVDGEPLGFYHFTGFDKGDHEFMVRRYAPDNKTIWDLIDWYKTETATQEYKKYDWKLGMFADGQTKIAPSMRTVYQTREDLQKSFPNPFAVNKPCFLEWYRSEHQQNS